MVEEGWLKCDGDDTGDMEEFLSGRGTDRQLRLFACACCRHIAHLLTDPRSRAAVEVAERYADGKVDGVALAAAWAQADAAADAVDDAIGSDDSDVPYQAALSAHWCVVGEPYTNTTDAVCHTAFYAQKTGDLPGERAWQAQALNDILGGTKITVDPSWETSTVVALAHQMYDTKDFSPAPILADALEDAGCENEAILNHLRGPGPHVRGCWVIDLILGKE